MSRYPIPARRARCEETIRRSRFITTIAPAASADQARQFVAEMRAEFAGATHNCHAFAPGPPGSTAQAGMSDDGEPSGTAGRPMLAVLLGGGIGDVAAVVTRYYGGIKLGTGGLVRAYAGGVKNGLAALALVEKIDRVDLIVRGPYHWIVPVTRLLPDFEARVDDQDYSSDVTWRISVPEERAAALAAALVDLSRGEIGVVPRAGPAP